ncbi:hypothetical protein [Thermomonas sp.]|uniref:hypothetical protein n=1 Tax=Thermomonas sp. TaxID=1971895 RepID=UPI002596C718|nr:hypothetical protein [Thermomonas sp.]HOC10133.1 hypothetical protein [Thermomonas sp.]HQA01247.1 hypothetical protein [Thermomonas sp.]HQE08731.1 hypothetical protein [Thermomonas sp.]
MRILNWRLPIFTQFAGLSGQMQSMMPAKQKTALRRSLTAPESGVLQSTGFFITHEIKLAQAKGVCLGRRHQSGDQQPIWRRQSPPADLVMRTVPSDWRGGQKPEQQEWLLQRTALLAKQARSGEVGCPCVHAPVT